MVEDFRFYHFRYHPFLSPPPLTTVSLSLNQQNALQIITDGVRTKQGFVILTGAAGLGKTTVLNVYLEHLDTLQYTILRLDDATLSLKEMFTRLCHAFGLTVDTEALRAVTSQLHPLLQEASQQGRYVVLMVDDAHALTVQTLWNLRMLSDLMQTPDGPLLQIILAGRPELERQMSLPELQSLQTRLTARAILTPMTPQESRAYIQQHCAQAGAPASQVFTSGALLQLAKHAQGNPRTLNTLCTEALLAGLIFQQKPITAVTVREIATELHPARPSPWLRWGLVSAIGLMLSLGLLGGWLYANWGSLPWDGPVLSPPSPPTERMDDTGTAILSRPSLPSPSPQHACESQAQGLPCTAEAVARIPPPTPAQKTPPPVHTSPPPRVSDSPPRGQDTAASEPPVPTTTPEWDDTGLLDTRVVCVMPRSPGARGNDIVLMDYKGSGKQRLVADGTLNLSPSLSPDGSVLAYTSYREGTPSVYLRHLTTGTESRLTPGSGLALAGSWSPNGRYLALSQSNEGNSDIFLYDTARQHLRRLTSHSSIDVSPHFAPDNSRIVFTSDRSGSPQLYLTNIEGRAAVRLTHTGTYNTAPAWSPNDETIAFIGRSPEGSLDVYTIQADGTNLQRLTSGRRLHKSLTWAPDGRFVMSSSQQGAVQERHLIRTDGQGGRALPNSSPVCQSPQWIAQPLPLSVTR